MKLLKTKKEFYNEILKLASENPTFFYMASYNLNVDDNIKKIFKKLPAKCDVKIIIGLNENASIKQREFLKNYFSEYEIKLLQACHLKLIVTNKGVILGGRNLTDSDWKDLSVLFISKNTISEIKKEFLKHFKQK